MKVLVLGGTGNIGSAIVEALVKRGASVSTLCRNERRAERAEVLASTPLLGDISAPETWVREARNFDAVIHAACTFDENMGAIDANLTHALIEVLSESRTKKKLVYTGGGWCYGATPPAGADESASFNSIPEFIWAVENSRSVLRSTSISGITVHPSNVVDKFKFGVPPILVQENQGQKVLRAPGTPDTKWPLVEREDLAQLYCLVLEKGEAGHDYLGTSEEGVPVKTIVSKVAKQLDLSGEVIYEPIEYWMKKYGNWARGYALDQVIHSRKAINELGWAPVFRIDE